MESSTSSTSSHLVLLLLSFPIFLVSSTKEQLTLKDVDLENPVLPFLLSPLAGHTSAHSAKDIILCERVRVAGLSRLKVSSYANSYRVTVKPLEVIPDRLHSRIEVCFHRNYSMGLCQCEKDEWKTMQKGTWRGVMSPYEDRYVDVKLMDGVSSSVTISLEEDFQQWRLFCLAFGFVVLLLAPIVSHWVPFYYSSSMALGILLVILILLFQGMKLVPTGRKSIFYLTIYGSVLGAGSFLVHYFSIFVNSVLVNFGLSEDMHNPVSIFLLVGILLAGAAVGHWVVRKFFLTEDGTVDVGIAQFVKWAMRVIAVVSICQSTLDTVLAMASLFASCGLCYLITSKTSRTPTFMQQAPHLVNRKLWQRRAGQASANHRRAEFLSKSPKMGLGKSVWKNQTSPYAWSSSPNKGLVLASPHGTNNNEENYYSTFHKTPTRKKFSKREWEAFTSQSTRKALAEWASSPEFTDWIIENADRVKLVPDESSEDGMESGSEGSSEETALENQSGISLLNWY